MTSNTLIHPQFDAGIISSLSVLSHLVLESSSLLKLFRRTSTAELTLNVLYIFL